MVVVVVVVVSQLSSAQIFSFKSRFKMKFGWYFFFFKQLLSMHSFMPFRCTVHKL